MIQNKEEYIICSAVWYQELELKGDLESYSYLPKNLDKGIVFCGHRHGQCIYTKCAITGLRDGESGPHIQGFLTSKNRFVDRVEALEIALRNDQVLDISDVRGNKLHSEDIY